MTLVVYQSAAGFRWILRDGMTVVAQSPVFDDQGDAYAAARQFKTEVSTTRVRFA